MDANVRNPVTFLKEQAGEEGNVHIYIRLAQGGSLELVLAVEVILLTPDLNPINGIPPGGGPPEDEDDKAPEARAEEANCPNQERKGKEDTILFTWKRAHRGV